MSDDNVRLVEYTNNWQGKNTKQGMQAHGGDSEKVHIGELDWRLKRYKSVCTYLDQYSTPPTPHLPFLHIPEEL